MMMRYIGGSIHDSVTTLGGIELCRRLGCVPVTDTDEVITPLNPDFDDEEDD